MSDFYTEQLIKRKTSPLSLIIKVLLILLTVLSALVALLIPYLILLPIALIVLDYFIFRRQNVEYEYLYVNGDLDIDVIFSKQKRKKRLSTHVRNIEIMAPAGASEVRNIQVVKSYDFSSGIVENKRYEMILAEKGQKIKVLFEPNQTILDGIRIMAPRKVIL